MVGLKPKSAMCTLLTFFLGLFFPVVFALFLQVEFSPQSDTSSLIGFPPLSLPCHQRRRYWAVRVGPLSLFLSLSSNLLAPRDRKSFFQRFPRKKSFPRSFLFPHSHLPGLFVESLECRYTSEVPFLGLKNLNVLFLPLCRVLSNTHCHLDCL